mmetsp:Transcript_48023/g.51965  ORF Transcript_48023/g.51965 Transcript_48023/m.51965 type:complete len:106 (+) Transcript_48023:262-579(+)
MHRQWFQQANPQMHQQRFQHSSSPSNSLTVASVDPTLTPTIRGTNASITPEETDAPANPLQIVVSTTAAEPVTFVSGRAVDNNIATNSNNERRGGGGGERAGCNC